MVLEEFIQANGIKLNPAASIKKSNTSGYGIYLNVSELLRSSKPREIQIDDDDDAEDDDSTTTTYEILRIPNDLQLSVRNCSVLVATMDPPNREYVSNVMKFATSFITASETVVLTLYLMLFLYLEPREEKRLSKFKDYFAILSNTVVPSPLIELLMDEKNKEKVEQYYKACKYDGWEQPELFTVMISKLQLKYPEIEWDNFRLWRQVVRSRVLEIPREIDNDGGNAVELNNSEHNEEDREDESENDSEEEEYSDDEKSHREEEEEEFEVDTSLVPILDFANHDNSLKNAWYDVDRETGDILLIYELKEQEEKKNENKNQKKTVEIKDDEEIQIYISYTPQEDMKQFAFNYGFIPTSDTLYEKDDYRSLEICMDRKWVRDNYPKIYLYMKYFKQLPNVQFLLNTRRNEKGTEIEMAQINLFNSWLFLGFSDTIQEIPIEVTDTKDAKRIAELEQDLEEDFLIFLDPSERFTFRGKDEFFAAVPMYETFNDEESTQAMKRFIEFVIAYMNYKLPQLKKLPASKTLAYELIKKQIELMQFFINYHKQISSSDPDFNEFDLIALEHEFHKYRTPWQYKRDQSDIMRDFGLRFRASTG